MRRACQITLNDADRAILRTMVPRPEHSRPDWSFDLPSSCSPPLKEKENKDIATELKISRGAVARWRDRFAKSGVEVLEKDAPRGGRPPKARRDLVQQIIAMTTQQKPANATRRAAHAR